MMRGFGGARIVRHHHDGFAELEIQAVEQFEDVCRRLPVQIAGRLVGDHQQRVGHQRARDRDSLLLAA